MNSVNRVIEDSIPTHEIKVYQMPSVVNRDGWIQQIRYSEDKKLKFYVFKLDTLIKYKNVLNINTMIKKRLNDALIVYNEEQLNEINWKVVVTK